MILELNETNLSYRKKTPDSYVFLKIIYISSKAGHGIWARNYPYSLFSFPLSFFLSSFFFPLVPGSWFAPAILFAISFSPSRSTTKMAGPYKPVIAIAGLNGILGQATLAALLSREFKKSFHLPIRVLTRTAADIRGHPYSSDMVCTSQRALTVVLFAYRCSWSC